MSLLITTSAKLTPISYTEEISGLFRVYFEVEFGALPLNLEPEQTNAILDFALQYVQNRISCGLSYLHRKGIVAVRISKTGDTITYSCEAKFFARRIK